MKPIVVAGSLCFMVVFLLKMAFDKLSNGTVSIQTALLMAAIASIVAVLMEVTKKPKVKKYKDTSVKEKSYMYRADTKRKKRRKRG